MKIWICRHGETEFNKQHCVQGLMDIPLNDEGMRQAVIARECVGDIAFDAVFSSPLERAKRTGCIVCGVSEDELIIDERISEVDFGKYDGISYIPAPIGFALFWALPWVFPAPETIETVSSIKARAASFIRNLEEKNYENVFVSAHGGIIRALCGYLENRPSKLLWYPRPTNCEIRVYERKGNKYEKIMDLNRKK